MELDVHNIIQHIHTHEVDYTNIYAKDKHHVAFSKCSGVFYTPLQGVWQLMCNQILRIQRNNCQHLIFTCMTESVFEEGFAIIRHHSFIPSADGCKETIHTSVAVSLRHLHST
jgi:hypothetical protein